MALQFQFFSVCNDEKKTLRHLISTHSFDRAFDGVLTGRCNNCTFRGDNEAEGMLGHVLEGARLICVDFSHFYFFTFFFPTRLEIRRHVSGGDCVSLVIFPRSGRFLLYETYPMYMFDCGIFSRSVHGYLDTLGERAASTNRTKHNCVFIER